jgi:hypothetical protein
LFEFENVFHLNYNFGFEFKTAEKKFQKLFYFSGSQIGLGPNSLEAWSILPPSQTQLHPAHFGPVRPTSPSSPSGSGGPLLPFGPAEVRSLFSFLRPNARAATALTGSVVEEAKCHMCLLRSPHQATPERLPSLSFSVSKWLVLKTHRRPLLFLPRPLTSLPRPI